MVFFMHGILDTAMGWVCNGVTGSNAFAAYDAGYDVWLGNSRANPPRLHMGEYMCCCTNLDLYYMHTLKGRIDVSTGCNAGPICARCSGCFVRCGVQIHQSRAADTGTTPSTSWAWRTSPPRCPSATFDNKLLQLLLHTPTEHCMIRQFEQKRTSLKP